MFMTGCVVLITSSCHDKNTDRLWCIIGLCQVVISKILAGYDVMVYVKLSKTSQTMSYLH